MTSRGPLAAAAALLLAGLAWAGSPPEAAWPEPGPRPPAAPGPPAAPPDALPPMRFGLDAGSLDLQLSMGVVPDYATLWIGPWNLEKGWRDPERQLAHLRDAGVAPAIHFYYWGDHLSPQCLAEGCAGRSVAGWLELVAGLGLVLNRTLQGTPALVVLETEFNKASVARHEPLDALLAGTASALKAAYPPSRVVLGLGGWYPDAWDTWDRAAAASDAVGVQAMAGVPHDEAGSRPLGAEALAGAARLRDLFGKPIVLQDIAAPSGPAPASGATQDEALALFIGLLPAFKDVGVDAMLYRSFVDDPWAPAGNYFGEAERHFGLAASAMGDLKPAGEAWVAAMHEEQGRAANQWIPGRASFPVYASS